MPIETDLVDRLFALPAGRNAKLNLITGQKGRGVSDVVWLYVSNPTSHYDWLLDSFSRNACRAIDHIMTLGWPNVVLDKTNLTEGIRVLNSAQNYLATKYGFDLVSSRYKDDGPHDIINHARSDAKDLLEVLRRAEPKQPTFGQRFKAFLDKY